MRTRWMLLAGAAIIAGALPRAGALASDPQAGSTRAGTAQVGSNQVGSTEAGSTQAGSTQVGGTGAGVAPLAVTALAADMPVEQTVFLAMRRPAEAEAYARAVQTPGPLYRRFLSRDAFVRRFAPTDADVAAVEAVLTQLGYSIHSVYPNHLAINVVAPAGVTETALGIRLVRAMENGRAGTLPQGTTSLPASIRTLVRGIGGLDTLHRPAPQLDAAPGAGARTHLAGDRIAGGKPGFLLPQDFAARYGVTALYRAGLTGRGATIGIVTLAGFDPGVAYSFWRDSGLSVAPDRISVVAVDGGPAAQADETFLDVEQAGGVAPGAALRVYEAPDAAPENLIDGFETAASENLADTVSSSWGQPELNYFAHPSLREASRTFLLDAFHDVFLEMGIQGQSVFVSAGDSGAYDTVRDDRVFGTPTEADPVWNAPYAVGAPADDPAVVAAGGTTVPFTSTLDSGVVLHVAAEQAWSTRYVLDQTAAQGHPLSLETLFSKGGGGGVSAYFHRPFFQDGVPGITQTKAGQSFTRDAGSGPETLLTLPAGFAGRNLPDLSADADPRSGYQLLGTGGALLDHYGGTSFVAPQFNGVAALAVQGLGGRIGAPDALLYGLGERGSTDIATGGNWGYAAAPGYDNASGLGVLDASKLAQALLQLEQLSGR